MATQVPRRAGGQAAVDLGQGVGFNGTDVTVRSAVAQQWTGGYSEESTPGTHSYYRVLAGRYRLLESSVSSTACRTNLTGATRRALYGRCALYDRCALSGRMPHEPAGVGRAQIHGHARRLERLHIRAAVGAPDRRGQ